MAEAGLGKALPTLMVVACSLTTLTLAFLKSTGVPIGLKDYDMVMSMPDCIRFCKNAING